MNRATDVAVKEQWMRLIPDGQVYAVRVGSRFFAWFEGKRHYLSGWPTYVTLERAEEIAARIPGSRIVPALRQSDSTLWISETEPDGSEAFSKREIFANSPVRTIWNSDKDGIQYPEWFIAGIKAAHPEADWAEEDDGYTRHDLAWKFFCDATRSTRDSRYWRDHEGWTGVGEDAAFISEPYHVEAAAIQNLVMVCEKWGFTFHITGKSEHYPSATFRIAIRPKASTK